MTDRVHSLTVVLEADKRIDDVQSTINAIEQVKGVLSVTPNVADFATHTAEQRVRFELGRKLWEILYPPKDSD